MKTPSILQIIMRITVTVSLVELTIMVILMFRGFNLGPYEAALLDVTVLAVFSTPIIYFWIIKPYVVAHKKDLDFINHVAYHDPLTELPNRRLLVEFIEKLISTCARHKYHGSLLFIDLDGFKNINDKNGHNAGDAVLIEVAKRLKSLVRVDDIVGRIGGDEFVVVLNQLDTDERAANNKALIITQRIQQALNKVIYFKDKDLQIGSSIGLRHLKPELASVDAVLKDADMAMYRAKKSGKGRIVVFNDDNFDDNVVRIRPIKLNSQ